MIKTVMDSAIFEVHRNDLPTVDLSHIEHQEPIAQLQDISDVMPAIAAQERWLWQNAIDNPDSFGGNKCAIALTAAGRYPALVVSVTRTGNIWQERWIVQGYADMPTELPPQPKPKLTPAPLPSHVKQYRGRRFSMRTDQPYKFRQFWSI